MDDLLWTKRMLGAFKANACLNEEEEAVLDDWAYGRSIVQTAMKYSMCTRRVNKIRHRLRQKYDAVQLEYPELLPPRRA